MEAVAGPSNHSQGEETPNKRPYPRKEERRGVRNATKKAMEAMAAFKEDGNDFEMTVMAAEDGEFNSDGESETVTFKGKNNNVTVHGKVNPNRVDNPVHGDQRISRGEHTPDIISEDEESEVEEETEDSQDTDPG